MKDYLSKMKGYVDFLASCGDAITNEDQILFVLGGIGLEYDSVVVRVTSGWIPRIFQRLKLFCWLTKDVLNLSITPAYC